MKKLVFSDRSMLYVQRVLREEKQRIIRAFYKRVRDTNEELIIVFVVPE